MKITISSILVLLLIVFSAPLFVVIITGASVGWFSTDIEIQDFAYPHSKKMEYNKVEIYSI